MLYYQTNRRLAIVIKFAASLWGVGYGIFDFLNHLLKKCLYETFTNQDEAILNSWSELKYNYILRSVTIKYKNSRYCNILDLFRRHENVQGRETHKILSFLFFKNQFQ